MDDLKTVTANSAVKPHDHGHSHSHSHGHDDGCGCGHDHHHGHALDHGHHQAHGTLRRAGPKIGRNEPCACGSGKKSKKCCGG